MSDESASSTPNISSQPTRRLTHPPAIMVVQRGAQAGDEFQLLPGINLFGREEGILLLDHRVSRRHAEIQHIEGQYILVDLHSTNGSYVNSQQVVQPTLLQHGDIIRFGDTILMLKVVGEGGHDPDVLGARTAGIPPESMNDITLPASRVNPENVKSNPSTPENNS